MTTMVYPADFGVLDDIREFVAQVALQSGFSDKEIYSLQLAADEAATNIIEHAYDGISNGKIQVACEMQGDEIVIAMHDDGRPFDPSKVKKPNLKAPLSDRQIGGLGVYLMHKLMDSVQYESTRNSGNLLIMTKRRE